MLRKWKATRVPKVLGDWRKPRHEAFEPRTAWSLFNCFTETMKEVSLFNLAPRTQALHGVAGSVRRRERPLSGEREEGRPYSLSRSLRHLSGPLSGLWSSSTN